MPVTADAADAPVVVRFTFNDPWPSAGDFDRLRSRLIAAGQFTLDSAALFDLRNIRQLPRLSIAELERFAERPSPLLPRRRAYLAASPLQSELAQQLQALGPEDLASGIFSNEDDAMRWLAKKFESPSTQSGMR